MTYYTPEQQAEYPYRIIKGAHKGARARLLQVPSAAHYQNNCIGWVLLPDGEERQTRLHRACLRRDYFPNAIE